MKTAALCVLFGVLLVPLAAVDQRPAQPSGSIVKYVRFSHAGAIAYGILDGSTIQILSGAPFASGAATGRTVKLADVELLAPCEPSKVIAVGLNYRSHLGERPAASYPGLFAKYPTTLIGTDADIIFPPDASNVHYEGEMVVVIGARAKNVSVADGPKYVFGVTAGNDVSERDWQKNDLQWFRAKASDTFGPLGPAIVKGLDYNDLQVQTRVNGEVRQSARTSQLIFDVPTVVSYVSRFVTLLPGDIIYTGTPGTTRAMKPGDVVEVEVEGVGVLRNTVKGSGERTNFTGEWVLNAARSKVWMSDVQSGTVRIDHKEPAFSFQRSFTTRNGPSEIRWDMTTDGREKVEQSAGERRRARLYWEGDQLVFDEKTELIDRSATNVVRYRLENGGKTLVARESFRAPKLQYDNVWVFDRK